MEKFRFVTPDEVGDRQWDQLVADSPDGWLYQTTAWMGLASRWGSKSRSFAVLSRAGELTALFPLYRDDLHIHRIIRVKRFYTGLSGPVASAGVSPKARQRLWKAMFAHVDECAHREGVDLLQVRLTTLAPSMLPPDRPEVNPLFYVGCVSPLAIGMEVQAVQPLTRIIYLDKAEEQLLMEMDGDCRAAMRQAERFGVAFVAGEGRDALDDYVRLHRESWKRTGLSPHPIEYFHDMWDSLQPHGAVKVFFALHEERIVAAVMVHVFKQSVFYWGGCSAGDALHLRPNNFLLWNTLKWAKANGYRFFEIGQFYPHPTRHAKDFNVGKYKTQFGRDELVPFEGQKVYRTGKLLALGLLRNLKATLRPAAAK